MWEAQISELSGKYQVIAPDLPYFGESILAEYGNNSNSMEGCADAVSGLLDEMNLSNTVICGISMGGYIAFELWRKYPQKINALILADTRAEGDSPEARQNRRRQIALIKEGKQKEVVGALTDKLVSDHTKRTSPGIFESVRRMASGAAPEALIPTIEGLAGRRDSTTLLHTINVPTLIIVGEDDALTPPSASVAMHKKIKNSELCIMPRAGHLSPMEDPAYFNEYVNTFLAKIS